MRIAVISDLHIGAEDFSPDGFEAFLDHLEHEHDEIILLGDVFECYFPLLPWRALADYDRFDRRYAAITGADVSNLSYYRAFNSWKTGCILHGVYARYMAGQKSTEGVDLEGLRARVDIAIAAATAFADQA